MFQGLRFFLRYGWKFDKRYVLWLSLYQLVNALIPIVATVMPRFIIEELMGGMRKEKLLLYVGILAGYSLFATALSAFLRLDSFSRRCAVNTRFDSMLYARLIDADYEMLESPRFLDMQEKAKKFLYCDRHGFGYLLDCAMNIVGQLFTLAGIAAVVFAMNPLIVLLFAALAMLGAVVESRAKQRAMRLSMEVVADMRSTQYYATLFESYRYGKEIRLNAIGGWLLRRQSAFASRANRNQKRQNDLFIRSRSIGALLTFVQQCVSYAYLIGRVMLGAIGIGEFMMYVGAVTAFAAALRAVMDSLAEIRTYDMYYDELDAYLNVPTAMRRGTLPRAADAPVQHGIEFKNVGFRYAGAEAWALRGIDLTIHAGERLSVVGENGAGKTTFAKLLCRLYDPTEGAIYLDGVDIRKIAYDDYMRLLSAVFQDFELFAFSLRDNITLGSPVNDDVLHAAIRRVGLEERVRTLPNGLDTAVGRTFDPEGFEPSGGEAQKIALARSLVKDAPVILLDEPTAALDPRAEYGMLRQFDALVSGKTAVYISHRLSSARFCDNIAVFVKGRIAEYGTHAALMAQNGVYAELFRMQAQYYQ